MKLTIKEHLFCAVAGVVCTAAFLAVSLAMCGFMFQVFMKAA